MTGTGIPEGSVVITPTDMYKDIVDTHRTVQAISTKLDTALSDNSRQMDEIKKGFADHESRVRSLERFKWTMAPLASALGAGVGAVVAKAMSGH